MHLRFLARTYISTLHYFTIRRQDKEWSGVWTDMNIEQTLMRSMKSLGGLTRGRGLKEDTLMRWILCAPVSTEIASAVEHFIGIFPDASEQHKDLRESSLITDATHVNIFMNWIKQHNPFKISGDLVSVCSGIVGDITVSCDRAVEKGKKSMKALMGKNYSDVVIPRKARVIPLGIVTSSIKVRGNVVPVNIQQLFNRIICLNSTTEDLKEYFKYELAPRPPALFTECHMRKGKKSSLVSAFQPEEVNAVLPPKAIHVIDGGHLINSVVWPRPGTYGNIMEAYKCYLENHFGKDTVIVFDGYPDTPTTKGETHAIRYKKKAPEVLFNEHTYNTLAQCDFLSNVKNKKAFITALANHLINARFEIHQATGDADVLITTVALQHAAEDAKHVIVVGQDTDLLVLLTSLSTTENIWFFRPKTCNKGESMFNISKQRKIHHQTKDVLLFSHAMSGCDTTSSVFRKGKVKSLNLLKKEQTLKSKVTVFNKKNATKEEIVAAGEEFIIALYGKSKNKPLDEHRFYMYHQQTAKQKLQAHFDLASLPPTSAAAAQHSFRVYYQVQQWLGNNLDPCQWGWSLVGNLLQPVATTLPPAPEKLLHLISCRCKGSCNSCECKRAGLLCSAMCSKCEGRSCENSPDLEIEENDVELDD